MPFVTRTYPVTIEEIRHTENKEKNNRYFGTLDATTQIIVNQCCAI